ncbi:MAG TPA: hypothetical protein PKV70_02250, partial [Thermodesulfobacteriota bacterium]|nr:hypothetical protein [Thermodesulfobacteriota bacterium]
GRDRHVTVTGKEVIAVEGLRAFGVKGDVSRVFDDSRSREVGGVCYMSGNEVVVEGDMGVSVKAGGSFITLNKGGVFIKGNLVMLNEGGAALAGEKKSPESPKSPLKAEEGKG